MSEILEAYEKVKNLVSLDEFQQRVGEKMAAMGNLCDERTAALLVAHDLGVDVDLLIKIKDIDEGRRTVFFVGKIIDIISRDFKRKDGTPGRVSNLTVGDETASMRVVVWDENLAKNLKVGDTVKIRGFAREGRVGIEVHAKVVEPSPDEVIEVKKHKITDIQGDMSAVNLVARVLEPSQVKEFTRKDSSTGKMRGLVVGDETGRMRVVVWDERAEREFPMGSVVEIANAYSRERFGRTEVHVGAQSSIEECNITVDYEERLSKIADIEVNKTCSIIGNVSGVGSVREFISKTGVPSKVGTVHLSDDTGRIRVSLWGDLTGLLGKLDIGTKVKISDGYARSGFNDEVEISADWRSKVEILR